MKVGKMKRLIAATTQTPPTQTPPTPKPTKPPSSKTWKWIVIGVLGGVLIIAIVATAVCLRYA